ncbi:uncharacterized protein LOC126829988 [Patella vulgata]|uniref:uncharacterized protein LOC126829988 n=1 Tax=Patella vulgata TaxID=6465 RepID=UPI0024A8543E|nr:uncharacterized protein LOC126829988 [Patella vulgata]
MIDEDSTVTFNCLVDSLPSSVISWSRSQQGGQLYSGSQYTISKASCQHIDNYTCTASNNIGQPVSKTIPLFVKCSPRENTVTKRNITNRIHTTINLEVDIIAYPRPTFTWYHTPTRQIINTARTQQLSTINYKSTVEITLNSTLFGDYIVSVYNDIGVQNFTITVIDGEPPKPPGKMESNNIPIIVGSVVVVLLVIGIIVVVICCCRKGYCYCCRKGYCYCCRKAKKDSSQDNVHLSNKEKKKNELVIDDNLTYEGSDHLFGPQNGAGTGKGQTDNIPMSSNVKTGNDNKMVIDDNVLYEGSDHIFGSQNGTESGKNVERGIFGQTASSEVKRNSTTGGKSKKSKKPPKKPDPEAIYTEVIKKKTGQDNKTASAERGNYENSDVKAKPTIQR